VTAPTGIAPGLNRSPSPDTKDETKRGASSRNRELAARLIRLMKRNDLVAEGWQIRGLLKALNVDEPTDDDLMRALMAAPWYPKRRRRHWRVGEGGGWATRS
jgi:hypothetical protein